ncbi:hypothetical protein EST38_g13862 [Candolleomyces aberdarensis]|uniref:DNA replication regulator Sld3 C-terminal domain-containing protein n=1 Tax=Candolleomyces aberdarensis TaxID=2316362 RepID=A0A4Q2CYX1_9AGAR|nr:hypothetical protein EST38_g13862 [Candolleomyces aberdarensis]
MPLHFLVPSLRRIKLSSSSEVHPLHGLLDDILLTVLTVTNKYRKELLQILLNGGGAGEMEEGMMWFALSHEQADEQEPWLNVQWRDQWLDRLERREVQIQILLYYLKLSLPPAPTSSKPKGKRKRSTSSERLTEDYLEAFMDKLSMWQLLNSVQSTSMNSSSTAKKENERDWMQIFCEEVVEPEFKSLLPELCILLRTKVFPHSPFSDTETEAATSRPSSPVPEDTGTISQSQTRISSRAPSTAAGSRRTSPKPDARELARARSRSLSVSLAQEREQSQSQSNNGGAAAGKRRAVTREISMSRVFKPKPKPATGGATSLSQQSQAVEPQSQSQSQSQQFRGRDLGLTLVEDTPVKPREPSRSRTMSFNQTGSQTQSQRSIFPPSSKSRGNNLFGRQDSTMSAATDNDDAWQISSSPDIRMIASPVKDGNDTDEDDDVDMDGIPVTPSRPSRARKGGKRAQGQGDNVIAKLVKSED